MLNGLERTYGPAELCPLFSIVNGHVKDLLRPTNHLGAFADGSPLENLFDGVPALVFLPKKGRAWEVYVVQNNLGLPIRCDGLEKSLTNASGISGDSPPAKSTES